ncbi:hypothetical protein ACA910_020001 [Epithemia clementina (nom. ined.)]
MPSLKCTTGNTSSSFSWFAATAAATGVVVAVAAANYYYCTEKKKDDDEIDRQTLTTQFEEWMTRFPQPTLAQQLELAAQLYRQATPSTGDGTGNDATAAAASAPDNTTSSSSSAATAAASTSDNASPNGAVDDKSTNDPITTHAISWQGIQLSWFLNVLCQFPYLQRLRQFGCPIWFVRKVAMYELLRQRQLNQNQSNALKGPLIQYFKAKKDQATRMIIYDDHATLDSVLNMLEQHAVSPQEDYVWIDFLCVDPTAYWETSDLKPIFQTQWTTELPQQLNDMHHMTLILDQDWKKPSSTISGLFAYLSCPVPPTLQNLSSVQWPLYCAAQKNVHVSLAWPRLSSSTKPMIMSVDQCLDGYQSLMKSFMNISVKANARSTTGDSTYDFGEAILQQMKIQQGCKKNWNQNVNTKVWTKLRESLWMDMNRLASTWHGQGRLEEASWLYKQALELCHRQEPQSRNSSNTTLLLVTLNNCASLSVDQEEWLEAESLYRQVWQGFRQKLGDKHPETCEAMFHLATVLEMLNQLQEQEECQQDQKKMKVRRLIKPMDFVFGSTKYLSKNPRKSSLSLLNEAELLYRQALTGQLKFLGKYDVQTLNTTFRLAELLRTKKKLSEAQQLYRDAVTGYQEHEHNQPNGTGNYPNAANGSAAAAAAAPQDHTAYQVSSSGTKSNCNSPYHYTLAVAQHRLAQMQDLMRRHEEVNRCRKEWGDNHALTWMAMEKLALLLKDHGRFDDAERLCRQIWEGRRNQLGHQDYDTLQSMCQLADLLRAYSSNNKSDSKAKESKALYREAIQGFQTLQQQTQNSSGKNCDQHENGNGEEPDPITLSVINCLYNLADLIQQEEPKQRSANNISEAEALLRLALQGCRDAHLGEESSLSLLIQDQLAQLQC